MQPSVMIHKYLTAECCDWPIKIQYFRMSCNKNCISHWSAQNWEAFNVFFLRKCVISVMRRRPEDLDEASVTFRSFWGDLVRRKESKHYLKEDISYTFPWNIASYTASLSPDVHSLYVTQASHTRNKITFIMTVPL